MTRLGYGALEPRNEWSDLREILGRAQRQLAVKGYAMMRRTSCRRSSLIRCCRQCARQRRQILPASRAGRGDDAPRGRQVQVRVTDQGPGIPPESREAVFDLFYGVKEGDKVTAGTGLGLAI